MAKAIITLEDTEDGQINVQLDFGDGGLNEKSDAHIMAIDALTYTSEKFSEPQL